MPPTQVKQSQIQQHLSWQGAVRILENRIFKIRTPGGHGTGFHICNLGTDNKLSAIATAYHVIDQAHDWGESMKLIHATTGKEFLLRQNDRAIFTFSKKDLAIIICQLPDAELPSEDIKMLEAESSIVAGVDIGWCGFPGLRSDKLCFFHGFISSFIDDKEEYLIDGTAINGVSGGPVFYIDSKTNRPSVIGVITAYIANRATGETLPGLSMASSVAPYEARIKSLRNMAQAKGEADQQNATDAEAPQQDPPTPEPTPKSVDQ